jgi:ATP-dependent Clp protease ATP-binding subunit ClpA
MTDDLRGKIFISTSNIGAGATSEEFKKFAADPAFLERFKPVEFKSLSKDDIARISGKMVAKTLGDRKLSPEQEKALGEAVTAVMSAAGDAGADPSQGMRGVLKNIDRTLSGPLSAEAENIIAACSPAFAAKTGQRRGESWPTTSAAKFPFNP